MSLVFLHTADWHIGKSFGGVPEDKRPILREARLSAIDRIAAAAVGAGAGHVLVGGDVFDSQLLSDRELRQPIKKLSHHARLTWHLLPGNHDPARAGGVWERLLSHGLPPNVIVHLRPEPVVIGGAAVLLPAPLTAKGTSLDPTGWMDQAATPDGMPRIGLAHGSVQGFGTGMESAVPISPSRPTQAGLAYLALGDWHGVLQVNERVWYSGTPEPDRMPDNEPGFALIVRIDGPGAPPRVERVATAHYCWHKRQIRVTGPGDLAALQTDLARLAPTLDRVLLKLEVAGIVTMNAWAAITAQLHALDPALFHCDADLSGLHAEPEPSEIAALAAGELRDVAERLRSLTLDPSDPRALAAGLALKKLYLFARAGTAEAAP